MTPTKTKEKAKGYVPPKWVPDPWNHDLNPITMLPGSKPKKNEPMIYDYELNIKN